jgi:hypothetical protein
MTPSGAPADIVQSGDADAALVHVKLSQALDNAPTEETIAVANVRDPVLKTQPVVNGRDRHRNRCDFTLQWEDGGCLAAIAADAREIARVGLKVVPVACVDRRDDHVQSLFGHEFAHEPPAPVPLGEREPGDRQSFYLIHCHPRLFF